MKTTLHFSALIALSALFIAPVMADDTTAPATAPAAASSDEAGKKGPRGKGKMNPEMRKKMIEKFDKDGDGKLNEEERAAAKAARPQKPAGEGAEGKGPKGPRGKMTPEMRKKMLEKFDKDGDGKLSEEERAAVKAAREARKGNKGAAPKA